MSSKIFNRFDTMSIAIPTDLLLDYDRSKFGSNVRRDSWRVPLKDCDVLETRITNNILGLCDVYIDNIKQEIVIEFSAKFLKTEYMDGVHVENILKIVDLLKDEKIMDIEKSLVLEKARVYKVDVTENLKLSKPINEYIEALTLVLTKGNYIVTRFNSGIMIKSAYPNNKFYIIFYDKSEEIRKALKTRGKKISTNELLKHVPMSAFDGILRVELGLHHFNSIRKEFCLDTKGDIDLKAIFNFDKNILDSAVEKVTFTDFSKYPGDDIFKKSIKKRDKLLARIGTLSMYNGNVKLNREYIKKEKGYISSYDNKLIDTAAGYLSVGKAGAYKDHFIEIREKLRDANK